MTKKTFSMDEVRDRFASSFASNQEARAEDFDRFIEELIAANIAIAREQWFADDATIQEAIMADREEQNYWQAMSDREAAWYAD